MRNLRYFSILCMAVANWSFAQNYVTLNRADNGTKTYTAGQTVTLSPGYQYKGSGQSMRAYTTRSVAQNSSVSYGSLFNSTSFNKHTIDRNRPVGLTPGSASVSPTGAATYTIPIQLPKGTAGMEPSIALAYNSQAGNGIAGQGWNISGLSMISRVPQTRYHDGETKGVSLNWRTLSSAAQEFL